MDEYMTMKDVVERERKFQIIVDLMEEYIEETEKLYPYECKNLNETEERLNRICDLFTDEVVCNLMNTRKY